MKRWIYLLLTLAALLPLSSCRRAVEKARRNIRVEAVEGFERRGLTGAEVTLRVKNGTRHRLRLDEASLDIYFGRSRAAAVVLHEPAEVAGRTTASVRTSWRIRVDDPLALLAAAGSVRRGDLSQCYVTYSVAGRGGPAPVKLRGEMVPVSDFLNNFGLSVEDVKNFLKK